MEETKQSKLSAAKKTGLSTNPGTFLALGSFLVVSFGVAGLLFYQNYQLKQQITQIEILQPSVSAPISKPVSPTAMPSVLPGQEEETEWVKTGFMGTYSFDYPAGWHVVSLWPGVLGEREDDVIVINPHPISTAPRGGVLGEIVISDTSGLPNPNELFQTQMKEYKDGLQEFSEEIFKTDIGTVYHIAGKANIYMQPKPVERYYFMIQYPKTTDNLNKHVIYVETVDNPSRSEMLRAIVESFRGRD